MATESDAAAFRARSTALYQKVRSRLILLIVACGGLGLLAGALIGHALGSRADVADEMPAAGWLVGGLIGLAAGAAAGALVAAVVWFAASLLYAMTQDGA